MGVLAQAIELVSGRILSEGMAEREVSIRARVLSAEEAIGNPTEYDFPLLKGREKIVEARLSEYRGHAFTDMYGGFQGTVAEVMALPPENNYNRALQVATINALAAYWGLVDNPVHCKDEVPKQCAGQFADFLEEKYPQFKKIAFVGYQPAMLDALSQRYEMLALDLDRENIGTEKFGLTILDGQIEMASAVAWGELILATGSTLVNGTIDDIIVAAGDKEVIFYGVTIAGVAALLELSSFCRRDLK